MNSFPISIDLAGRKVVVVGGGDEALRKARLFARAAADIWIVAEKIDDPICQEFQGLARLLEGPVTPRDFDGAVLAVIADSSDEEIERFSAWARSAGAMVNVVDRPAHCDYTTPAIIDRDQVVVSISTGGAAPVLGQWLRGKIEALAPKRLGDLAAFANSFRDSVKAKIDASERRKFWASVLEGPIGAQFLSGDEAGAREAMIAKLNGSQPDFSEGVVHIVGAGPGDPELLTLKAHRLLQEADVILYDKLVSEEIINLARRDADRIFVGKSKANHSMAQEDIGALLVEHARQGKIVVRLKGGDPFVFGRGGEELDTLKSAGVKAYVTPGITAATGCAASVGMALTHRDFSQAVTFVTGHAKGEAEPDLNWSALATLKHTLAIYMGVGKAALIAEQLIAHGRGSDTPIAIIENGTRPEQRTIKGSLRELGSLVKRNEISGPALLIVGEVAALAEETGLDNIAYAGAYELNQGRLSA